MPNDSLAVFLYRYDDANDVREASTVAFGETRQVNQYYPSTVIGVATRPVGAPIDHHDTVPEYESREWRAFRDHVEDRADDVRWFDDPLECDHEQVDE